MTTPDRGSGTRMRPRVGRAWLACVPAMLLVAGCKDRPVAFAELPDASAQVTVLARAGQLATWPCMERCHSQRTFNTQPRELREFHAGRRINHGNTLRWCDACHDSTNLDQLHMLPVGAAVTSTTVPFDEAYRVCGQCHAEKYRDWELSIHGSTTGSWSGDRVRRNCTTCHDPHDPHRPSFDPIPLSHHDRAFPQGGEH